MLTNDAGSFEWHTIRPGHYPGMRVPAHIHFSVWGGGEPLQWLDELRFAGYAYLTDAMKDRGSRARNVCDYSTGHARRSRGLALAFRMRAGRECNFL